MGTASTAARSMKTAAIAKSADLLASMIVDGLGDEDGKLKSTHPFISGFFLEEQEVDDTQVQKAIVVRTF